jgi:LPXTG-motif cell wall-anchored protein
VTVVPPSGSDDTGTPVAAIAAAVVGLGAVLGAAVLLRRRTSA